MGPRGGKGRRFKAGFCPGPLCPEGADMKNFGVALLLAAVLAAGGLVMTSAKASEDIGPHAVFRPARPGDVTIADSVLVPVRRRLMEVTLPTQWEQLERHHHVDNFRVAAGEKDGVHLGPVFLDSDLYKWLEAASYALGDHPGDEWLSARVEELTGLIEASQMDDGYLNTYYSTLAPDKRYEILYLNHELYCAGHFMEAACARFETSGDRRLLNAATALADNIGRNFGPGKIEGMPGHQEIELALVRLYRATGEERYLDLAARFVLGRGHDRRWRREFYRDLFDEASLARRSGKLRKPYLKEAGEEDTTLGFAEVDPFRLHRYFANFYSGRYFQVDAPLIEQTAGEGHSVRAMYYYAGGADLYLETGDERLRKALEEIWHNTISKRTYITGGMGSLPVIEGFGKDYELPNDSYTETCAAISNFFFSWRMLRVTGQSRHADQMERALYNAILSGIGLDGKSYFYRNPLRSDGGIEREPWYVVACCPPNLARFFASIDRYIYGVDDDGVYVHLYIGGDARFSTGRGDFAVSSTSLMPFGGDYVMWIMEAPEGPVKLRFRRPGWSPSYELSVNGKRVDHVLGRDGYIEVDRIWTPGEVLMLDFDAGPRTVAGPEEVRANRGRRAVMLGPLVYCFEDRDNPGVDLSKAVLDPGRAPRKEIDPSIAGGVTTIKVRDTQGRELTAIPYFAWANRGPSRMEVWMRSR